MILSLLFPLFLLIVGAALLIAGADWFLDGAGELARALGMSALVLGVLLAGLEPEEMLTAAIASARGAPALAVGNVIGTNVTIATVALGLSALITPMVIGRSVRRQALIATLISIPPILLLLSGTVSRLAGVFLLLVFVGYTLFLVRTDRDAIKRMAEEQDDDDDDDDDETTGHTRLRWKPVLLTAGGLAAIVVGGPAIVEGALRLAQAARLDQGTIGATIVSLGTGAEMLALGVSAARKRRSDILVGGILGSFAYNLLVTLGLAATIHTLPVDTHIAAIGLPVMVIAHLLLLALVWCGKIPRAMGALLIALYIAYIAMIVLVQGTPPISL